MANRLPNNVVERGGAWFVVKRYRKAGKRHCIWRKCETKTVECVKETLWAIEDEIRDMKARETFGQLLSDLFQLLCHGNKEAQGY